jgi:hypothetical protein
LPRLASAADRMGRSVVCTAINEKPLYLSANEPLRHPAG